MKLGFFPVNIIILQALVGQVTHPELIKCSLFWCGHVSGVHQNDKIENGNGMLLNCCASPDSKSASAVAPKIV